MSFVNSPLILVPPSLKLKNLFPKIYSSGIRRLCEQRNLPWIQYGKDWHCNRNFLPRSYGYGKASSLGLSSHSGLNSIFERRDCGPQEWWNGFRPNTVGKKMKPCMIPERSNLP